MDEEWRLSLKVGDKIDALKEEAAENERVEGWGVAIITEATETELTFTFDGIANDKGKRCYRNEPGISPLGSRTGDWEWRNHLEIESQVDVFDTQAKWYLSTVLDTKVKEGIRMVKIGFRVYVSDGMKLDDNGRLYEGWSTKYDTWLPVNSIRIQRYL